MPPNIPAALAWRCSSVRGRGTHWRRCTPVAPIGSRPDHNYRRHHHLSRAVTRDHDDQRCRASPLKRRRDQCSAACHESDNGSCGRKRSTRCRLPRGHIAKQLKSGFCMQCITRSGDPRHLSLCALRGRRRCVLAIPSIARVRRGGHNRVDDRRRSLLRGVACCQVIPPSNSQKLCRKTLDKRCAMLARPNNRADGPNAAPRPAQPRKRHCRHRRDTGRAPPSPPPTPARPRLWKWPDARTALTFTSSSGRQRHRSKRTTARQHDHPSRLTKL